MAERRATGEEWNDDFRACPKCSSELTVRQCHTLGCDDGEYLDEDGINGDSWERCDDCQGTGYERWCKSCGWDDVFKCFLSPKYEAAYNDHQAAKPCEQREK